MFLRESLDHEKIAATQFDWSKANPLHSFKTVLASPTMRRLALITLLYYTAIWGVITNLLVYATTTFQFTSKGSGLLLSMFGLLNTLIQVRNLTVNPKPSNLNPKP